MCEPVALSIIGPAELTVPLDESSGDGARQSELPGSAPLDDRGRELLDEGSIVLVNYGQILKYG